MIGKYPQFKKKAEKIKMEEKHMRQLQKYQEK